MVGSSPCLTSEWCPNRSKTHSGCLLCARLVVVETCFLASTLSRPPHEVVAVAAGEHGMLVVMPTILDFDGRSVERFGGTAVARAA